MRDKVFKLISKIPKGEVRTYKQIAKELNTSPRAIAKILSSNKTPLIIPCHRVICSNNTLGGYTFKGKYRPGLKFKLLKLEGIKIKPNKILEKSIILK